MLPHAWLQFGAAAIGIVALEVSARAVLGYFDPSRHGNTSVQKVRPLVDSVLVVGSWPVRFAVGCDRAIRWAIIMQPDSAV